MSKATSEEKAHRYLTEGRVKVVAVDASHTHLEVQGTDLYEVTFRAGWVCNCPARKPMCAHVIAAQLICPHREPRGGTTISTVESDLAQFLLD